jgi:hypothetical protein
MRAALVWTLLLGLTLPLVAHQPASGANRTGSLHVATFKDKDGAFTTHEIAGARILSLYDNAGHFDCRRFTKEAIYKRPEEEKTRIAAATEHARDFIWQHWQAKKRGYIRITFNSVDATSTSHIFIEPDASGVWQLTWRIVRHNDRVNDVPPIRIIEQKNERGDTLLVFKTANGEEQETL